MHKFLKTFVVCILTVIMMSTVCYAKAPYSGYNYDDELETIPSLLGYTPTRQMVGSDFGIDKLTNPSDMKFDKQGNLYIADTGNNRIIVLNSNFKVKNIITGFDNNGKTDNLNAPQGVSISNDDNILIADTSNSRVVKLDKNGKLIKIFPAPKSDVIDASFKYYPQKIVEDKIGRYYVVSKGCLEGLIQLDSDGNFSRFFGSNKVNANPITTAIRNLLPKKYREKLKLNLPIEYSNAYIDPDNFLYVTTKNVDANQVKRLNSDGDNILRHDGITDNKYGDVLWGVTQPQFVDVQADEYGNVISLDNNKARVYIYNALGDLLFIFGGRGSDTGMFQNPMAVESRNGKIYVLDATLGNITEFGITEFGKLVMDANNLYMDGKYVEAEKPWREVLKRDQNYQLAYVGIGNALYKQEKYKEAMKYFKLGYSHHNYSKAFKEYRTQVMRNYFSEIVIAIIAIIFVIVKIIKFISARAKARGHSFENYV